MKTKRKIVAGIFILSLVSQSMNALSLMLSGMSETYPDVSISILQMVFTMLTLASVAGTLLAGKLACLTTKKRLAVISCLVMAAGGLAGRFLGVNLPILYVVSAVIGVANGILIPVTSALIAEHFEGGERASVVGFQALFVNGGGMLLNLLSGVLVAVWWRDAYLVLLPCVPVMIAALLLLPEGKVEKSEKGGKVKVFNGFLTFLTVQAFIFGICWMTFYTNVSYSVSEKNLGNSAGVITAVFSLGAVIIGFLLRRIMAAAGKYCFAVGLVLSAAGLWIFFSASALPMFLLGAFLQGAGFGLYMPSGYTMIPDHVNPAAITMSISIFTAALSIGGFINPYVITTASTLIGSTADARYLVAAAIQTVNVLICLAGTGKIMAKDK